jgi:hypothetical protein
MATATVGRADIEKVVRKVLNQEREQNGQATLKAIQRISSLLTEQVIPHLPDQADAEEEPEDDEHGTSWPKAFASRSWRADDDTTEGGDDTSEDDDSSADVPQPVMEAFESLYGALSPEQATALATFFTAVGDQLKEGGGSEDEDDDSDADADTEPGSSPHSRSM